MPVAFSRDKMPFEFRQSRPARKGPHWGHGMRIVPLFLFLQFPNMSSFADIERQIAQAMRSDQFRLRRSLQAVRRAASRAFCMAGSSRLTSTAITPMTTSSSTSVKPRDRVTVRTLGTRGSTDVGDTDETEIKSALPFAFVRLGQQSIRSPQACPHSTVAVSKCHEFRSLQAVAIRSSACVSTWSALL